MLSNLSSDEEVLEHAYIKLCSNEKIKEDLLYFVYRPSFSVDPHMTAHNEGERALALRILQLGGVIE